MSVNIKQTMTFKSLFFSKYFSFLLLVVIVVLILLLLQCQSRKYFCEQPEISQLKELPEEAVGPFEAPEISTTTQP